MTEPRCRNCKWWDENQQSNRVPNTHPCKLIYSDARKDAIPCYYDDRDRPKYFETQLFTGPDFSCCHFEARETVTPEDLGQFTVTKCDGGVHVSRTPFPMLTDLSPQHIHV